MSNQIIVSDRYNLVPGLFEHDGFVKADHGQVEVLLTSCEESFQFSERLTVFVDSEPDIHDAHEHFVRQQSSRPNAIWAVSATSPSIQYQFDTVVEYHSNLVFTTINNQDCCAIETTQKPWLANVLLGGYMPNRQILFEHLNNRNLSAQCLINFQPRPGQQHFFTGYRTPELDQLDSNEWQGIAKLSSGFESMIPLGSPEQPGWLSQKISWAVYNSSWLSVVAETENLACSDTFLPSEKIAKPLLLGQPFLVQGCCGFLAQLKKIGFQTFDPWINEHYDSIENSNQRIAAMIDSLVQFARLSDMDKTQALTEMKPILDHNRNLMLNLQCLTQSLADKIRQKLAIDCRNQKVAK